MKTQKFYGRGSEEEIGKYYAGLYRTEKKFQDAIISLAKENRWLHYHTYDSRRSVAGFPDLVLVREGRILFRELKVGKNKMSLYQKEWAKAIREASGDFDVWRPEMMEEIIGELTSVPF